MVDGAKIMIVRRVPARKRSDAGAAHPPQPSSAARPGGAEGLWSGTIRGEPTPQARLYDVVVSDGVARLVKSRPARIWQDRAVPQLLNRRPARPLALDLVLDCRFWSSAQRPPIDEGLVIEVLERAAIIAHGRQIREKHVFAAIDRDDPRVTVSLAPAEARR
jgi:hypothetical protein